MDPDDPTSSVDEDGEQNSDTINSACASQRQPRPKVHCPHCSKLLSKSNINGHIKRCKARIYDASRQDKDELIEKVIAQQEHISDITTRLRDLQEQFNIEHQLRLESDKKFETVMSKVCIISRQNLSEVSCV